EPVRKFVRGEMCGEKPVVGKSELLEHDVSRARALLADAGYPNGERFPVIRLLINRNEQQRVVAQAIAAMWRTALNVETEIIVKNWDEYEAGIRSGDYDVVRRGIVMQTTDEFTNLRMLFERDAQLAQAPGATSPITRPGEVSDPRGAAGKVNGLTVFETEADALKNLTAMPIYFASSYALVKPYVSGFDANVLDVPSLKKTRVDSTWVEKVKGQEEGAGADGEVRR